MSSNTYNRVKIIPYPDGGSASASATSNNNNNSNQNSSSKQIPIALQFALHNLSIPNHHHDQQRQHHSSNSNNNNTNNVPPPARTLFFCIASDQLFPTEEALSQVCADPVDFSRICAKFGRGGEVPRPDFVGGYTRAIPTAQKVHQQKQFDEHDDADDVTPVQDENNHRGKHNTTTFTKWVYVAEARVTISEHILASLLGETTHEQQFFVLFTTAFFDRSLVNNNNSNVGDDTSLTGRRRNAKNNTDNDDYHNDGFGSARSRFSSNPEQVFGRPLVKIKGDHHHHHSAANTKKNNNNNAKPEFDHNQTGRRRGSSQQQHQHQSAAASVRLARENAVCVVDLSPELISADLEVKFGPHDRSWLHRFMSVGSTKRKNNNNKNEKEEDDDDHIDSDTNKNGTGEPVLARGGASGIALLTGKRGKRKVRDPFEAAKQLCTHRLHIGDDEMMREMAVKFNEFLIGSTQDARRFCSFHAARMRIPIVFEHGMRSPQCQVFLQFLRSMRTLVSKKCIPEPPPHVASSIHHSLLKAEFLEERPLLEVMADLSVRFDRYHHPQQNRASSNSNSNNNKEDLLSSSPPTNDDDIEWNANNINTTKNSTHHPRHSPLEDPSLEVLEENSDEHDTKNNNKMKRNRNDNENNNNNNQHHKNNNRLLLPHEQRGYYGPEVRSVFAPWRIEWLDFLLLVCVETRLWREIFVLIERFYELSDAKLLSHPEYNHEETALRINLFANAQDIEEATGYPVELRDAVRIATRCSQFCKASPANRALVFRIRHMTQVPYVQRILFDPKICMFEELCCGSSNCSTDGGGATLSSSSSSATLGRILWCLLVPLKVQQHVTAVIGRRDNGVPMVTTPKVAARQFRAFVLSSHIGDQAFKQLILRRFLGWVQLIRERRIKRKQQMQLQMSVRTSMVQNMDSRKTNFVKWMNHAKKMMKLRREGKIPPREQHQQQQPKEVETKQEAV